MSNIFYFALLLSVISISQSSNDENFFLKYQKKRIMRALEGSTSKTNVKCFYIESNTYKVYSIYDYNNNKKE